MKWLFTAFFILIGLAANAQSLPALYDVRDVAAGDVLNVRSEPTSSSDIVALLQPDVINVEIIALDEGRRWGRINMGEQSGWVSLRFLERQPNQHAGDFPAITACYGTEPFWDLQVQDTSATLTVLSGFSYNAAPIERLRSANRTDRFSMVSQQIVGVIQVQACSDGMSDRAFGLSIEVLTNPTGDMQHLSGCCTIQP